VRSTGLRGVVGMPLGSQNARFREWREMVQNQYQLRIAVILLPQFEFDDAKSRANAEKHGIDVHAAQESWLDASELDRKFD